MPTFLKIALFPWRRTVVTLLLMLMATAGPASHCAAQMVSGAHMPGYAAAFGLGPGQLARDYTVQEIGVQAGASTGANVLWPGESAAITFRLLNPAKSPLQARGQVEIIQYGTSVSAGDVWVPNVLKLADMGAIPIAVDIPPDGSTTLTVRPKIPERFGGYALIVDLGPHGRAFGAALVRTLLADPGRVQFPTYALDLPWPFEMSEAVTTLFQRLGVKAARLSASYTPTMSSEFEPNLRQLEQWLQWAQKNNITVMLTLGAGPAPQPLGRPRPWLDEHGSMLETKSDMAWLPQYDEDFEKWCRIVSAKFGWPKGPVNAVELWNEPWEGTSISGWGADMIRYRELYTRMAHGVEAARRMDGVQVLIGGACSSSNTRDKLFADGSDTFLKWLDFVSIHYQPMAADPALVPEWIHRRSPYGPVRVWDTESWVANSEDRVAAVIASMRAQGQSRTAGIYGGNVYESQIYRFQDQQAAVAQAWSTAAALAASQKFIGQRAFQQLLFKKGLPWLFVFDGLPRGTKAMPDPDDGTLVVVGDLGGVYDRHRLLFRSVLGLKNAAQVAEIKQRLAALPAGAPEAARTGLAARLQKAQVLEGGSLTLPEGGGRFVLYDFYGNPAPSRAGKITVPLNGRGYFLRTNGSRGSFERLLEAVAGARIEGYEPLEIVARDLLAPISARPALRLTLTNILNRPLSGRLDVKLGRLRLESAPSPLHFSPHETKELPLRVVQGAPAADNTYPLSVVFDAGKDGQARHEEAIHVNVIARRAITVDGDLADWNGVLPQMMSSAERVGASLTEKAYLPYVPFDQKIGHGLATVYAAYDDRYFYFAARIADDTPDGGSVRFETRDDDQYFYPEKCYDKGRELTWPAGVRRFSYRRNPDLPSGNDTDNVQIAFNVIPQRAKPWLSHPPGTMPRFMAYPDTDYEYALNSVAPRDGGGTEIWRLLAPGVPRKHFYPRQPKALIDGGPVKAGRLAMRRVGNTRIVEASLPWPEIPLVRKRLDASLPIKFTVRVNDNGGPAYELAAGRSVSKDNFLAFHNDWTTHWANELEFGFEPAPHPVRSARR